MNYGPLVFLAAFFALASSWCGFVLTPQLQIGHLQQTNMVGGAGLAYPTARPGLAGQGLEVYRANGCAYCHSQQVGQTGSVLDIALMDAGTNQAATIAALLKLAESVTNQPSALTILTSLAPGGSNDTSAAILDGLPKAFFRSTTREAANVAAKMLNSTSAKAQLWVVPVGPGGLPVRCTGHARFAARRSRPRERRHAPARCQLAFASSLRSTHRS